MMTIMTFIFRVIFFQANLGFENAALDLWRRAAFSRPRSQFFTIPRTDPKPANNIYSFNLEFEVEYSRLQVFGSGCLTDAGIDKITEYLAP